MDFDPSCLTLARHPGWGLVLTLDDIRSWLDVRVVRAFPLSETEGMVAFLDAKGREIGTIPAPDTLPKPERTLVTQELETRYVIHVIERVLSLWGEGEILYWHVATPRGRRDFVIRANRESFVQLDAERVLLIDVDGNRFMIPDVARLDRASRLLLEKMA